jgi:hypothetical protein
MIFSFLTKGNEIIAVPQEESYAWFQLDWEWLHDQEFAGAMMTANGWLVPHDGGYVNAVTAYKAGLSTHLNRAELIDPQKDLTDDELYEALGDQDIDAE